MWDGWWFLMNRRAWAQVPTGLQDTVAKVINTACMAQRADVAQQNIALRKDLANAGMVFNDVDTTPFRNRLSEAGFYKEWRTKFGEEAWSLLEESVGKLA
jgi:TRAP-type transport system periplasmic protein